MMTKSLLAFVLSATLAVTGLAAAPARADTNDIGKVLLGVAAIAVIAKVASDNKKQRAAPVYSAPTRNETRNHAAPIPQRHVRANRKELPRACFGQYDTRRGALRGFGARCLQNNMRHHVRLPAACAQQVRTRHGRETIYAARCMRDYGYTIERGRR